MDTQVADKMLDQSGLRDAVSRLLQEGRAEAVSREQSAFDSAAEHGDGSLVLFGAGNLGRTTLAGLRNVGIEPVAFTDSNPRFWSKLVEGVEVLAPNDAARLYGANSTFVITIWTGDGYDRMADRQLQLRTLGCRRVIPFTLIFWKYATHFLPYFAIDLPHAVHDEAEEVLRACTLWSDDESRCEYLAQVRWRLLSDFDVLPKPVPPPIYFPRDLFQLTDHELFVDCGAYDGDTIRSLLQQPNGPSASIHAFEADPSNFERLRETTSRLLHHGPIAIHNLAVGASSGSVMFRALSNEASYISPFSGDTQVNCVTLDEILGSMEPTFIKMDIEGAEPDALRGASDLISRCAPVLAICSYHRQDHLWKIPSLIHSFNGDYRFYLRPHLLEGLDLVCYAVPPQRLRAAG